MDAASLVIVIDDNSDDDEVHICRPTSRPAKRKGKPVDMDAASWALIQKLQAEEAEDDRDGDVVVAEEFAPHKGITLWRERSTVGCVQEKWELECQRQRQEKRDSVLAWRVQQQEERKASLERKQKARDKAVAEQVQRDEEERTRTSRSRYLSKEEVLNSLEPCQLQAVEYVKAKAKTMSNLSLQQVKVRVTSMGFTEDDFHQCLEYIRDDAPIVIHLKEETLSLLVKDTHYRSQFETNTSGGRCDKARRGQWESDMFGNYYKGAKPFDRPKYGALNISGDIAGVKSARSYGNVFMILHQHVRHRSTFFNKDTGSFVNTETLATNEWYCHILNGYNDEDLSTALNTCKSARLGGAQSKCSTYKEVQIHGPICLATDIQALSIPGRYRTASDKLMANVLEFQKKADCNILWQEDLLNPEDAAA